MERDVRTPKWLVVAGSCALALVLSGCGGAAEDPVGPSSVEPSGDNASNSVSGAVKEPSAEQQAIMADGIVTRDEYEQGFRAYQACMTAAGESITVTNMDAEIIEYYSSVADFDVEMSCNTEHFQSVDIEWQTAHEDLTVHAAVYAECLQEHGFEPSTEGPDPAPGVDGRVRLEALMAQIMASGLDDKCHIPLELVEEDYVHPDDEGADGGQE